MKHLLTSLYVFVVASNLFATEFIVRDVNSSGENSIWIALPYVFSSDSIGLTAGVVGIFNGFIQPQMTIIATVFAGADVPVRNITALGSSEQTARSQGLFLAISGYKPSFSNRMFISFLGSYAYYPNQRLYLDGSNDSVRNIDEDNILGTSPLQTQGFNNWANVDFRFVLPFGEGKKTITPTIRLSRGIAVNRDSKGNGLPFVTGQTLFGTKYFYNKLTADKFTEEPSLNTNGLKFYLEHDNTDYTDNPSRGYNMKLEFASDFGWANSSQSWTALEAEYSHYFELPNFSWSRQNVLALTAWTAYSPSWKTDETIGLANLNKNQPPMWEGARLGGYNRMRAYDMNRFSDKAAIYGALEYRLIPELNPMHNQDWNPIPIEWFQTVLFAEAGRVAPEYNLVTLTKDLKYDIGFSIRALAANIPVRFEMAFGDEGSSMWVMVKQPF
ncbi:BamA/TamA family outer membrane protein [Sulfurimonas sp. SAG-AH-194-C21]|nr:BamA/TamA family outer membrane protein [Sulfurimonas sp. SAG-AH-194-C21]MDF1883344.1 BamA/TamA family outer membrane protein [Sulfurimonas sp. SAG-AH-194-C21]